MFRGLLEPVGDPDMFHLHYLFPMLRPGIQELGLQESTLTIIALYCFVVHCLHLDGVGSVAL